MSDIRDLLSRIREEQQEANEVFEMPASPGDVEKIRLYATDILRTALPNGYLSFLSQTNGLDFNGYLVFGASTSQSPCLPGFQDANELLARTPRQHAFYGHTSDEMYAQHLASSRWQVLDRASLSILEEFESFDLMLLHVLQEALA